MCTKTPPQTTNVHQNIHQQNTYNQQTYNAFIQTISGRVSGTRLISTNQTRMNILTAAGGAALRRYGLKTIELVQTCYRFQDSAANYYVTRAGSHILNNNNNNNINNNKL